MELEARNVLYSAKDLINFLGWAHSTALDREEAERLNAVYRQVLEQDWVNFDGDTHPLTTDDILVVSPYNMQVTLLKRGLPDGARVGTVDLFQG